MGFSTSKPLEDKQEKESKPKINKIKLVYNIEGENNVIRLFGDKFYKRYKNKLQLIINKIKNR